MGRSLKGTHLDCHPFFSATCPQNTLPGTSVSDGPLHHERVSKFRRVDVGLNRCSIRNGLSNNRKGKDRAVRWESTFNLTVQVTGNIMIKTTCPPKCPALRPQALPAASRPYPQLSPRKSLGSTQQIRWHERAVGQRDYSEMTRRVQYWSYR